MKMESKEINERTYQNGGAAWRIDKRLKLDRGNGDSRSEEVVEITDNLGNTKIVTAEDFRHYFIPTEVCAGDTVYEYSMGHILHTFIAKDIKDGQVSYRTVDGLKTALTTSAKVYDDCRLKVITPTANSPHSEYIFGAFYIQQQFQNLSILRRIRKGLENINKCIDDIGANTANIRQSDLETLLGTVNEMLRNFDKTIENARKYF